MLIAAAILVLWAVILTGLLTMQRGLLLKTWNEPYLKEMAVLIESDDWGPGDAYHAQRLQGLIDTLEHYKDSSGRPAVLIANMVLAVPDSHKIALEGNTRYIRRYLDDRFEDILAVIYSGIRKGILVPQLHGIEHFYGEGLVKLHRVNDQRVSKVFNTDDWSDWESLDPPLQAHYIDGTRLPTEPLPEAERRELITEACKTFSRLFNMPSRSTVAPCYLWDSEIERIWLEHGIQYIQTAGFRCSGRDTSGHSIQDMPLIRTGQCNSYDQIYLVRNAMYEPVDGRDEKSCYREALIAYKQGLPVVICTHRYNYTRSEADYKKSLAGLYRILERLHAYSPSLRYLSSPELGAWLGGEPEPLTDPATGTVWTTLTSQTGLQKASSFLFRLWYRHAKLRILAISSGLILPFTLIAMLGRIRVEKPA